MSFKNKIKKARLWIANRIIQGDYFYNHPNDYNITNETGSNSGSELLTGISQRVGYRNGDLGSEEYEESEYNFASISKAYDTDSYIRQGVDKYVDQIFKEGWTFYGENSDTVAYIRNRFKYISRATNTPTLEFLTEIAETVVKYSNCIIAKSRTNDPNAFPPGQQLVGLNGKDPVAGYYCLNVPSMKIKRDKFGTVIGWKQEIDGAPEALEFPPEDIIHIYYKREQGNAFGTPLLQPVLDDVRALRLAEQNVFKMMHRYIYPLHHAKVGTAESPCKPGEIDKTREEFENAEIDGGFITSERVEVKPIASDKVINAEPYLKYLESRVFSGLGIPAILFGRGETSNRSTGDNMANEMSDRVKAMQSIIACFINEFIIDDLLLEGGYDPILNQEDVVLFKFNENDLDSKIKKENHFLLMWQGNAITENEMRAEIGRDPIEDRTGIYSLLYGNKDTADEVKNKETPANQHGTKTSPKKTTNNIINGLITDLYTDTISNIRNCSNEYNDDEKVSFYTVQVNSFINNCKYVLEKNGINCNNIYESKLNPIRDNLIKGLYTDYNSINNKDTFITLLETKLNMVSDSVKNIYIKEETG